MLQINRYLGRRFESAIACVPVLVIATLFIGISTYCEPGIAQMCFAPRQPPVAKVDPKQVEQGHKLFVHQWTKFDRLCGEGDGLGPMFNAKSCLACHFQGGVGGGGTNDKNVLILSAMFPLNVPKQQINRFNAAAPRIHPGFVKNREVIQSFLLHRKSTDQKYRAKRDQLLGMVANPKWPESKQRAYLEKIKNGFLASPGTIEIPSQHGVKLVITQRNTPALFGIGLIDQIPDSTLQEIAKNQSRIRDGVSGRLALGGRDTVGKLGWRGQIDSTTNFVLAACAAELGLHTGDRSQTPNPLDVGKWEKYSVKPIEPKPDLTDKQTDALITFVKNLPRPEQVLPKDPKLKTAVLQGEQIFNTIRCNVCHIKQVGSIDGLYSDLLLHHMGPKLKDPVPAVGVDSVQQIRQSAGGYFGATTTRLIASQSDRDRQEWKTPPLWGVADSAPYLHDGRAATLHDAILLHGGESKSSVHRYRALKPSSRKKLILFLKSLRAPQQKVFRNFNFKQNQ